MSESFPHVLAAQRTLPSAHTSSRARHRPAHAGICRCAVPAARRRVWTLRASGIMIARGCTGVNGPGPSAVARRPCSGRPREHGSALVAPGCIRPASYSAIRAERIWPLFGDFMRVRRAPARKHERITRPASPSHPSAACSLTYVATHVAYAPPHMGRASARCGRSQRRGEGLGSPGARCAETSTLRADTTSGGLVNAEGHSSHQFASAQRVSARSER